MKTLIASTLIALGLLSSTAFAAPNFQGPTWAVQAFDNASDRH